MAPICVHITHIMGYLINYLFAQYTGLLSVSVHTGELNSSRGNKIWIYEWVYLCVCVSMRVWDVCSDFYQHGLNL